MESDIVRVGERAPRATACRMRVRGRGTQGQRKGQASSGPNRCRGGRERGVAVSPDFFGEFPYFAEKLLFRECTVGKENILAPSPSKWSLHRLHANTMETTSFYKVQVQATRRHTATTAIYNSFLNVASTQTPVSTIRRVLQVHV